MATKLKSALVIGNSLYVDGFALSSPKADAAAMATALGDLGFSITILLDLDLAAMQTALKEFAHKLTGNSVGVFYFSGHGVQDANNDLYILPIDFEVNVAATFRALKVQDIIDEISSDDEVRILLLDACRSQTASNREIAPGAKGWLLDIKGFYVGDDKAPVRKMRATKNTFVAFAASSQHEAYEGAPGELSPFTKHFARHIQSVDLPISNLTSRVRQSVFRETNGLQTTWDQSSLELPYFFNPGSSLLFTGNLMALASLLMALMPAALTLRSDSSWQWCLGAAVFPALSLSILLYGMQAVYERLRGQLDHLTEPSALTDHLENSLKKGAVGGYIGSLVAGLFIGVLYHLGWVAEFAKSLQGEPPDSIGRTLLEVTAASVLAGCLLGFIALFGSHVRWKAGSASVIMNPTQWETLKGCAVGGAITGLIVAPILMNYFAPLDRPAVTPEYLLPGAVLGSAAFIFSVVSFDYERLSGRRLRASAMATIASIVAGALATGVIFGVLYVTGVVTAVISWLEANHESRLVLTIGGALYGLPVGIVLGCVIGSALLFSERWSGHPVLGVRAG